MRRFLILISLALPACNSGKPADLPSVKIDKVRVGIPAGSDSTRSRAGAWCPVYVTLTAGEAPITADTLRVVVRSNDADSTPSRYTVSVPALTPKDPQTVIAYTRPGSTVGDIDVQVVTADGRVVQSFPRIQRNTARDVLEPRDPLLVAVGSRTLRPDPAAQNDEEQPLPAQQAEKPEEEIKLKNLAYLDSVEQMPDQWFGYEAADVVVLSSFKREFITRLIADRTGRREALLGWVRRGGRLVLSVGKNADLVGGTGPDTLLKKMPLIDCELRDPVNVPRAIRLEEWSGGKNLANLKGLGVTVVTRGPTVNVLVQEGEGDKTRPVLLDTACGLGRVVLVPFDVEANPFAAWAGRKEFWEKLQRVLNVRSEAVKKQDDNNPNNPAAFAQLPELLAEVQRNLETFREVPTVSFGWVALFTLFYIGLVGPLDYFVLKKVFKRLEMTWVTFPATVLIVSATAYFTAYWLKGDDLHVKKIDLVDIDLRDNTACGTAWFALFSPRIQNCTLGLEPTWRVDPKSQGSPWARSPDDSDRPIRSWTTKSATPNRPVHPTMLAVLAAPDQGRGAGSATLYPQPYDYTEAATGLEKVPIPIWATRSFQATWTAHLPEKPPVAAALRIPNNAGPNALPLGEITNNLPVALQGVALLYQNQWYNVGTLEPGEARSVGELFTGGPKAPLGQWIDNVDMLRPKDPGPEDPQMRGDFRPHRVDQAVALEQPYFLLKRAMFYAASDQTTWANSGMRPLDQSWRLKNNDNAAILVARAGPTRGNAEDMTNKGVCPTSLWLERLPGTAPERPKLAASLTQETYLRVYIPVARER